MIKPNYLHLIRKVVQARNWIWNPWIVCMCWMDLELCTRVWCKNWPAKELVPPSIALPEFLDPWGNDWSYIKIVQARNRIWHPWTVCMAWVDLELCTGVWCKNWPAKELVPPSKALPEFLDLWGKDWLSKLFRLEIGFGLSVCAEWILNFVQEFGVRTDLQRSWFHQVKLFLSFLICEAKTCPTSKLFRLEIGFGTPGLSACSEWILNFVQEFGVRTDLQRSWFHQVKLFLSFLICEADCSSYIKTVQARYLISIQDCLLVLSGQSTPYLKDHVFALRRDVKTWLIIAVIWSPSGILRTHKVTSSQSAWQLCCQSTASVS